VSSIAQSASVIRKRTIHITLASAILAMVCLFIFSLYHRWIHLDDAWFAEQAYQLLQYGYIRSEIFQGLLNYDTQLLPAHKLHVLHGAIFIKLFGFSPYVVKAVPIPYVLFLIFLLYLYAAGNQVFTQSYSLLLLVLIFISHAFVFDYAYIYRPELMQACIGFASFYFLQKGIRLQQAKYILPAALLAGICVLFHLNGLVFIMAGGLLLLLHKQIKYLLLFGSIAGLISLLYFYDICCLQENIDLFIYQFRNDPALEKSNFTVWAYFEKIFNEHMRLFRTVREGALSVCFFLSVFIFFRFLRQHHSLLLSYTFFLIFAVALITRDTNGQYYMLYLPFLALVVAISADYVFSRQRFTSIVATCVLLLCYFIINLNLIRTIIAKRSDLLSRNGHITSLIPEGARVMSSMYLVFNGLEPYNLQVTEAYTLSKKKNLIPASVSFLDFCRQHGREYIALDERDLEKIYMSAEELEKGDRFYSFLAGTQGYIILTHRKGNN
jgi:hypothetical protein